MKKNITGTIFNYFHICKRKMWLSYHQFNYEMMNDDVIIGKKMHELDEKKEFLIENIKIDEMNEEFIIEKKKSNSEEIATINQLLYYLYKLKSKGVERKGKIIYFDTKEEKEIVLTEEKEKMVENKKIEIENLLNGEMPNKENKKICKKCAFYDFCFS